MPQNLIRSNEHGTSHTSWRKAIKWTQYLVAVSEPSRRTIRKEPHLSMFSKQGVALSAGLLLFCAGFFLALAWDSILESQVNKQFLLSESSVTYEPFKNSKVEVYLKIYFWNWTNYDEDMRKEGYKPILKEVGPYTYREKQEKLNIVWNRNGTVSYRRRRYWYFAPEESNGTEDDVILTLNVVAKSAAFITRYDAYITRKSLDWFMSGSSQNYYERKKVRELLFEGYTNPLIDTANTLNIGKVPFNRFGWFYNRNGSTEADGVFNIETGANGMDHFGEIREWNYNNHTPFYGDTCGEVRGSAGEFFPPQRTKDDIIQLFSPDLCRHVSFHYAGDEEIEGIQGYRYEMKASMFDNRKDGNNTCFCGGDCAPSGALNVSVCRLGAPAFVTYPHFYMADPAYSEAVVGMNPDPARHGSHITMEPKYAVTLEVAARLQINILVQPYNDLGYNSFYAGMPSIYFPVLWFEQTARIPSDTASAVRTLVLLPTVGMSVAAILLVTGTALVGSVVLMRCCTRRKRVHISDEIEKKVTEPMIGNGQMIKIENGKISESIQNGTDQKNHTDSNGSSLHTRL